MAISHCYWHIQWLRMPISLCYWHVVVKNGNCTFLLKSSGQEWQFHFVTHMSVVKNGNCILLLTSNGQEWLFHIAIWHLVHQHWQLQNATDISWSRMPISNCYSHPIVKNGYFTLLFASSGQKWQFHITTHISVVKNGNCTFLLTSSDQEWQFQIVTHISVVKNGNFTFATDI